MLTIHPLEYYLTMGNQENNTYSPLSTLITKLFNLDSFSKDLFNASLILWSVVWAEKGTTTSKIILFEFAQNTTLKSWILSCSSKPFKQSITFCFTLLTSGLSTTIGSIWIEAFILKNNIFSNQYIEFFLEKVYGKMKFYYNYFKLRGDNNEKI